MSALATPCPHCQRDLAENQRGKHCTSKTCTWLNCSCGATVDPRRGLHLHPSDPIGGCTGAAA